MCLFKKSYISSIPIFQKKFKRKMSMCLYVCMRLLTLSCTSVALFYWNQGQKYHIPNWDFSFKNSDFVLVRTRHDKSHDKLPISSVNTVLQYYLNSIHLYRIVVLNLERFCPPRDIWRCLETFAVVKLELWECLECRNRDPNKQKILNDMA